MKDVRGKLAVITGGVSGIGLALSEVLAEAGARVVMTYRREDSLAQAREHFLARPQLSVEAVPLDVTDRAAVARTAREVEERFGPVHILCNNAGVNLLGPMEQGTYEDWDWILGVNLTGVINMLVTFLPGMQAHGHGGHIVNVASMSSFIAGAYSGIYATSKFAVRGLTESLRLSLAPRGIGVSLVCPGLTRSRIYETALHRPESLANTAFPLDERALERLEHVHSHGMDPYEVARKTLHAIVHNDFYVFTHPEFKDEVREVHEEIDRSFTNEVPDPTRLQIEVPRRQARQTALRAFGALKGA
jgi:NAD(P)-dependent dehydrogenase (short-subunit alcohol dehydrogenase family)